MADFANVVKLALDAYHGTVENYSVAKSQEVLRNALIEANCGSSMLNYKNIRDGKCNGLFAIVEEIISATIDEGFRDDDFFNTLVDYRNVALGDENKFIADDAELFAVAEIAEGTQGIRRQRLSGVTEYSVPTTLKAVRVYEELNRVLAGRVDFNHFITVIGESFHQELLGDVYNIWATATEEDFGSPYFPVAGPYDEDDLLDLIAHVEAAAGGKQAVLIGTKKALRNLAESIQSDNAKNELHDMGYYGKFYGTPCFAIPQRYRTGTTEFILDDNVISVIATDDRPLKVVNEGEAIVIPGDPLQNADLTMEYFVAQRWGVGIVLAGGRNTGVGRYEISTT